MEKKNVVEVGKEKNGRLWSATISPLAIDWKNVSEETTKWGNGWGKKRQDGRKLD